MALGGLGERVSSRQLTRMAGLSWLFYSLQRKSSNTSTINSRAQFSLYKHNIEKETGMLRNWHNQPKSEIALVCSTLCPNKQARMHLTSPPVGRPTTCMVTGAYLIPACTSPAGVRRSEVSLVSLCITQNTQIASADTKRSLKRK